MTEIDFVYVIRRPRINYLSSPASYSCIVTM